MKNRTLLTRLVLIIALASAATSLVQAQPPSGQPAGGVSQSDPDERIITRDPTPAGSTETWRNEVTFNLAALSHANTFGVEVAPAGEALRAQLGIKEPVGVVVTRVAPETAAAVAGLEPHDVILRIDAESVDSAAGFHELIGRRTGEKVMVHLLRQGKPLAREARLPDVPLFDFAEIRLDLDPAHQQYRIGVTLAEADDTLRSQLKLAAGEGLVVTDVVAQGPAAQAGLEQHDVLIKLDGQRLTTVERINTQIQDIRHREITVDFLRGGEEQSAQLAPQLSRELARVDFVTGEVLSQLVPGVSSSDSLTIGTELLLLDQGLRNRVSWARPIEATGSGGESVPDQLTRLKQQMAEMQRTIQALEAALQAPDAEQQPVSPPEDE